MKEKSESAKKFNKLLIKLYYVIGLVALKLSSMESPRMYENSEVDWKKMISSANGGSLTNNSNNSNSSSIINHNGLVVNKQQIPLQIPQMNSNITNANNNSNTAMIQKQLLQHSSQNDLEELTSQEISLDLQHLIYDQFQEQEALGVFTDLVASNNNNSSTSTHTTNQMQPNRAGLMSNYGRATLAYMPQPVHGGAAYINTSSNDPDGINIKEEPVEPQDYRRLSSASGAVLVTANQNQQSTPYASGAFYQIPSSYESNCRSNACTTLSVPNLHQNSLPHLPGNQLVHLKNKQILSQRKNTNKHVDKGTDEYKKRRERNNIAVRKSREKAKVRSREIEENVKALVKEKEALICRLKDMTNEIQLHKQLYFHLMNHNNPEVNDICQNVLRIASIEHPV